MRNSNDVSIIKCRIVVYAIIVVACVTLMACGNTSGSSKYNKKMTDDELEMVSGGLGKTFHPWIISDKPKQ